jgi:hypothetical protein
MALKQSNVGSAQIPPEGWMPETHFIDYAYGPMRVPARELPQEPSRAAAEKPLSGTRLKIVSKRK